jgi:hypothetical protein
MPEFKFYIVNHAVYFFKDNITQKTCDEIITTIEELKSKLKVGQVIGVIPANGTISIDAESALSKANIIIYKEQTTKPDL